MNLLFDSIDVSSRDGTTIFPEKTTYPSGEFGIKIRNVFGNWEVHHQYKTGDDLVELLFISDYIKSTQGNLEGVTLVIPFLPFARHDRVEDDDEAFSLHAYCSVIKSLGYGRIVLIDPHSDVGPALLHPCTVIRQHELIRAFAHTRDSLFDRIDVVLAPDAGAAKKAAKVANFLQKPLLQASKVRDPETGELSGFQVPDGVNGKNVFIADDIIDGGGTFVGIAKELKRKGAGLVVLFATHGIMSKGVDVLVNNGIDLILTTNTFRTGEYQYSMHESCYFADYRKLIHTILP